MTVAASEGLRTVPTALASLYDLALLDLDGVVYMGPEAVAGAVPALRGARAQGMRLAFVTNNASRTPMVVGGQLRSLGVPAVDSEVVTSAMAAASLLVARVPEGSRVLVVGAPGLTWAVEQRGFVPVDSVDQEPAAVVQGFGPDVGWRSLNEAARAVQAGLPWIATNTDVTVATPFGRSPGNGTLVGVVRMTTGVEPVVAGKPEPTLFREAVRRHVARRPLVVGDSLDTDMAGAHASGLPGLLVLTGVTDAVDLLGADPTRRPRFLGRDLGALLEPHEAPLPADGVPGSWSCGRAVVGVTGGNLEVLRADDDPLDLLRAGCAALWAADDARGAAVTSAERRPEERPREAVRARAAALLEALHALDPALRWAR